MVVGHLIIPIFSLLFSCHLEKSCGNSVNWQISLYAGLFVGENPTSGLQAHSRCTRGWFLGLITPVGSGQGAPSLTGPFWKTAGWCLNK